MSYSGATYKYTVLDTAGHRSAAQVGQLPQTSYQSTQTPYSFFGLGRTNNYIENLFVGTTVHAAQHYIDMEGVIPNSKVVILPSAEEGEWKRELFLRPGEWIPWGNGDGCRDDVHACGHCARAASEREGMFSLCIMQACFLTAWLCRERTSKSGGGCRIISTSTRFEILDA